MTSESPTAREPFPPDPPMPEYRLPDPRLTSEGRRVATAEEWRTRRRSEVLELFRTHVYGRVPDTPYAARFEVVGRDPAALAGAATFKHVRITLSRRDGPASGASDGATPPLAINLSLFVPNRAPKPVPAFLLISLSRPEERVPTPEQPARLWPAKQLVARGYALAAFHNAEVDPDHHDGFRDGVHGLLDGETRPPDAWGTIAAWAWGASRVMDYLETDPDIARDHVAVIGHSRGGKTALWAGAQDERFALVVSNNSGCTGAALSRRRFEGKESVARINTVFPHWFCETYKSYSDREEALPVDQHALIALIAPRAVAVGSASEDLWADPRGEFLAVRHATEVYRLLGRAGLGATTMPAIGEAVLGDGVHYHLREGGHALAPQDWEAYMNFADRVFARDG